jgi:hypothetical protein
LIPALVLVAATVGDSKELRVWILLFALVPWLTQSAADFLRVQILTVVIVGFCYWTFRRHVDMTIDAARLGACATRGKGIG